jgi:receptor-type tyrosine-protein phosphatase gamma
MLSIVPDGKPSVTSAINTSSSSIRLQWAPPNRNTIHGEFLGYRIKYRKHGPTLGIEREITLRDPDLRVRQIYKTTIHLYNKEIFLLIIYF